jgi:hypothetical protein
MRAAMRAKIGAGSAGTAAGVNTPLIDEHLRDAQTLLYWTHDWAHLRRYETEDHRGEPDADRLPDIGEP